MNVRLNGLKPQVQRLPPTLLMVSTPFGPEDVEPPELVELVPQAAASSPAARKAPMILKRLMTVVLRSVLWKGGDRIAAIGSRLGGCPGIGGVHRERDGADERGVGGEPGGHELGRERHALA